MNTNTARFRLSATGVVVDSAGRVLGSVEEHRTRDRHGVRPQVHYFAITELGRIISICMERDMAALRVIRDALPDSTVTLLDLESEPWPA